MKRFCFYGSKGRPLCLTLALMVLAGADRASAAQVTISGPSGSGRFGASVTVLANGNIVVTDPLFDGPGGIVDVGAVYLYRPTGVLISTLRGSIANDRVGSSGVTALRNGNYVVKSPSWRNGATANAGAVTFCSGTSGISGVVSPSNSLVGTSGGDAVGFGVTALANGNYVVNSLNWNNGPTAAAGAVTFGSGTSGISGEVSPSNSLVGTSASDNVGNLGVTQLSNGNYVVSSSRWDNGPTVDAGAVTFGSGTSGISGAVAPSNSLVGTSVRDFVGNGVVTALSNGNYVVYSPNWNNGPTDAAGAVTFGSGTSGISGVVAPSNSLIGSSGSDLVGNAGVTALRNGDYVVRSPFWNNGPIADAGAATFGSGTSGISGVVAPSNSLVGTTANDQVGSGVTALSNGNYVVNSPNWDNGQIVDAGAATFGSGTSGISGVVASSNSLVGTRDGDFVGNAGVTALSNGNYVVSSSNWDNGQIVDPGAATFGSGTSGISGVVAPSNSLIGTTASDRVGNPGVTALSNGNYVVSSAYWHNGATVNAGAATFGSGTSGISGVVAPSNSLVGTRDGDFVGIGRVATLSNGNYVVRSPNWDNAQIVEAGAVTFGSGTSGISGVVSSSNSLVGTSTSDQVGGSGVTALSNGNYVVSSLNWDNGPTVNAGAVTFGSGTSGISGFVSPSNSLVGTTASDFVGSSDIRSLSNGNYVVSSSLWDNGAIADAGAVTLALANGSVIGAIDGTHSVLGSVANGGFNQPFGYDAVRNQLAVGQALSNRVVLQRAGSATNILIVGDTPDPSGVGQPVTFTANVSGSSGPSDGQVRFIADNGQSCVDTTPTPTSAVTANFSCTIVFVANGTSNVIAEYTGSILHAYSESSPEPHTTVINDIFRDGFEPP